MENKTRNFIIIIVIILLVCLLFYFLVKIGKISIPKPFLLFFKDIRNKLLGIQEVVDEELGTEEDVYGGDRCIFLDSDLYNDKLFTDENKSITRELVEKNQKNIPKGIKLDPGKHYTVKCDECKKYVYKDEKGQCSPYGYDGRYTASNSLGVCTAIGYSKPCEQEAKILQ